MVYYSVKIAYYASNILTLENKDVGLVVLSFNEFILLFKDKTSCIFNSGIMHENNDRLRNIVKLYLTDKLDFKYYLSKNDININGSGFQKIDVYDRYNIEVDKQWFFMILRKHLEK